MPYLIDGHNLIPNIPGISLDAVDDEMQLVEVLVDFCRQQGKQAEVYFDKAPPGGQRARVFGNVTARFVRAGMTADDAIRARLKRLGKTAQNWTVVSSDRMVQAEARAARSQVMSAGEFAGLLSRKGSGAPKDPGEDPDAGLDEDQLDEWLRLFGE